MANTGLAPSNQTRSSAPVTGGTTATMTVTSPAWSGTSWTGGMAYGCTAALKTTGTGGKFIFNFCYKQRRVRKVLSMVQDSS